MDKKGEIALKAKRWLAIILAVVVLTALIIPGVSASSLSYESYDSELRDENNQPIKERTFELTQGDAKYIGAHSYYTVYKNGEECYDVSFTQSDEYKENPEYYGRFTYFSIVEDDVTICESSDPKVAVFEGALLHALSPGQTTVTIGSYDTIEVDGERLQIPYTIEFTVTVKAVEYHNPFEGIDLSEVENPFSDLSVDDWYYEDVMYLYAAGFFDGVEMVGGDVVEPVQLAAAGNGTVSLHRLGTANAQLQKLASGKYRFNGGSNAGRAWNVSVLYNGHQSAGGTVGSYQTQWFTDVPTTASYFQPVQWAAYTSTVKGYGGNLFGPLDGITREQFCTILLRYAQRFGLSMPSVVKAKTFSDASQISSWAKDAVNACQQAGIIKGMGNNTFAPKAGITTGQAAAMIHRFFENCTGGKAV